MPEKAVLMIIEDEADSLDIILRSLKKVDIVRHVDTARDGSEALRRLVGDGAPQELPHLILLDLVLPKVDGLAVLKELRAHARTRAIPVVILTAHASAENIRLAYAAGANSFIRKPTSFPELVELLQDVVRYWLDRNEVAPETPRTVR